ncbi:tRNA-dihydrouridine synthase [Halorientalis halophila]|uniref:tRNA-dihydrouridine synthase n=1 Tax=Halorientalis halophila TaxID=3108499 RepID=UPI00300BCB77
MSPEAPPDPLDFRPRVALASLSGEADADWARAGSEYAGAAFLGGIALDEPTREAARELVDRDRTEFLPADPVGFVDEQLAALADSPVQAGFNVRTTELEPLHEVGAVCRDRGAILEINAHCRQDEMCAAGAGEVLLRDADRLSELVAAAAETGATVSVKVRAEVPGVDLPAVARRIESAGGDAIHVDAMDSEPVVGDVAAAADLFVIANNEVRDERSVREYLEYGADAVSVGRPSDEPAVLDRVRDATEAWFAGEVEP